MTDPLTPERAKEWAHFVRFDGLLPDDFPRDKETEAPNFDAALLRVLDGVERVERPAVAPFEIILLKIERERRFVTDILYVVRDWLNTEHGSGQHMRFIVISHSVHDIHYLAYQTASLEEADRLRQIASAEFQRRWEIGQAQWLVNRRKAEDAPHE